MAGIGLRDVSKRYGSVPVIHGASLDIADGEFVVFVGPSGCGKSTLLRMIAGLEDISGGEVAIDGRVVNTVPARDRGVAMVFQNYALYPHMTVAENMSFGLSNIGTPRSEIDRRVGEAAEILQITTLLGRRPKDMSGGQRQRVAIGRAIVRKPKVFLFDEPLSNLDAALRVQMRTELAKLHHAIGATMIYVTHDQTEAMTMADRIVVLRDGRVEQVGRPLDLYRRPQNAFVAGFLGSPRMNVLAATVNAVGGSRATLACVAGPTLMVDVVPGHVKERDQVTIGIRPEAMALAPSRAGLAGRVDLVEQLGSMSLVYATLGSGEQVVAELRDVVAPAVGQPLDLSVKEEAVHVFAADGHRVNAPRPDRDAGAGVRAAAVGGAA